MSEYLHRTFYSHFNSNFQLLLILYNMLFNYIEKTFKIQICYNLAYNRKHVFDTYIIQLNLIRVKGLSRKNF